MRVETSNPHSGLLERFHIALVAAIESARPKYLQAPFTVSEIYQNLVPYRTHRDLIGVVMNGDYEDALMRLLAGEGDYLILESNQARQAIKKELDGRNPNTGLFREYAAAEVRLNPEMLEPGREPREARNLFDRLDAEVKPSHSTTGVRTPERSVQPSAVQNEVSMKDTSGWTPRAHVEDEGTAPSEWAQRVVESKEPVEEAAGQPSQPPRERESTLAHSGSRPHGSPANDEAFRTAQTQTGVRAVESGLSAELARLEDENRRLKLVLAERVLQIEELRERLDRLEDVGGPSS